MDNKINTDKLERFYNLQEMKREIEQELGELKKEFNQAFDESVGKNQTGEFIRDGYQLKRQIRKTEKFDEERTVQRLEELRMEDLIEMVRRPDKAKIQAAIELGLLRADQLEDLVVRQYSKVLLAKRV
ncbi:hypothetical protein [Oceanobacillus alkalisoli]|uniref:hypothetical protein n=1 Tax=Oceanobacillus alkalisoli TaxID=2925113 RepID=UPI001EE478F6|nr:hypothetical protein [Oceanobacillus alkalisoli]MCG5102618.1 hypothetical protein [Oceanobacillus alkalisoli]